jgi:cyanophycin synthetase
VQNALAAAAAGHALGLPWSSLAQGLRSLAPTSTDSLGRSNVVEHEGVRLLIDFAHNPASVRAALSFMNALRKGGRLIVITGHAGDRTDDEIRAVARAVHEGGADMVVARDLPHYLRGRVPGEVPGILRDELHRLGCADVAIAKDDVEGVKVALDAARPGDVIALFIHVDRELVRDLLRERGWAVG